MKSEVSYKLEDFIEELDLEKEVDLKVYSRDRFFKLSTEPSFESEILNDLIDIRMW